MLPMKIKNASSDDGRRKKRPGLEEQKLNIRQASVALFLQHGSRMVSIAQLCKAADVSRPTFYRCYKSIDALLEDLYQSSVNQAVEDILLEHISEAGEDYSWIKTALEALYDAIFEEPELAALVFRESNDPHSPAYHIVNSAFDKIADTMMIVAPKGQTQSVSKTFFKAVMVANQWIVHEAINQGLTPIARQEAKQACWILVSRLFDLE